MDGQVFNRQVLVEKKPFMVLWSKREFAILVQTNGTRNTYTVMKTPKEARLYGYKIFRGMHVYKFDTKKIG